MGRLLRDIIRLWNGCVGLRVVDSGSRRCNQTSAGARMLLRGFTAHYGNSSSAADLSHMTVNYCGRNNGPQRGTHSIWSGCPEGPGPDVSGTKTPQLLWKCDNTPTVWQLRREILAAVAAAAARATGLTYTRRSVWVTLQRRRRLFQ